MKTEAEHLEILFVCNAMFPCECAGLTQWWYADKKRARFEREWQQAQKHVTSATQFLGISEQQAGSSRTVATQKRSSAQHALEAWFDEC